MMKEKIDLIRKINKQHISIAEEQKAATRPILHDMGLIPTLYEWFCNILNDRSLAPNTESVTQRKKFLFIMLYLYSPGALIGKQIIKGLRDALCETLHIASRTTISDNCADVIVLFDNFKTYREEINEIYQKMHEIMLENKLVPNQDNQDKKAIGK